MARLQHVEGFDQRLGDGYEVAAAAGAGLGDREHLLLGDGQDLAAVATTGLEAVVDDARPDFDQLAQHRLVADDLGIGDDIGGRRRGAGQFNEIGAAGNLLGKTLGLEPLAKRDRVIRAIALGQFADGPIDQLVVAAVEIGIDEFVGNPVVRIRCQHEPAEDGLLGFHGLRWHAQLLDAGIAAALESLVGTKPLARTHRCCHSPCRIVDAIGVLHSNGHPSRPARKALQIRLWITGAYRSRRDAMQNALLMPSPCATQPQRKRAPFGARSMHDLADAYAASACTITFTGISTSACRCTMTSVSPMWRIGPSPITTSDFSTGMPSLVSASAISRGPTEP